MSVTNIEHYIQKIVDGEVVFTVALSAEELDALASHSQLFKRMVELINNWRRDDYYCPWCGKEIGQGVPHADNYPRKILLAEVAELERAK